MPDRQLSSSQGATGFISLSESFFTRAVPKIQDLVELKVVLYVAYIIVRKQDPSNRHSESRVAYKHVKAEAFRLWPELNEETLRRALNSAVEHGALSRSILDIGEGAEDVYSLSAGVFPPPINIFALYEQNIGIITPLVAEELKEAESTYPPQWIEEAFKEAVALNKRSWRYVARILERWATEGKDSGEHKRDIKKDGPDKYVKGKYGHLVKR